MSPIEEPSAGVECAECCDELDLVSDAFGLVGPKEGRDRDVAARVLVGAVRRDAMGDSEDIKSTRQGAE